MRDAGGEGDKMCWEILRPGEMGITSGIMVELEIPFTGSRHLDVEVWQYKLVPPSARSS